MAVILLLRRPLLPPGGGWGPRLPGRWWGCCAKRERRERRACVRLDHTPRECVGERPTRRPSSTASARRARGVWVGAWSTCVVFGRWWQMVADVSSGGVGCATARGGRERGMPWGTVWKITQTKANSRTHEPTVNQASIKPPPLPTPKLVSRRRRLHALAFCVARCQRLAACTARRWCAARCARVARRCAAGRLLASRARTHTAAAHAAHSTTQHSIYTAHRQSRAAPIPAS